MPRFFMTNGEWHEGCLSIRDNWVKIFGGFYATGRKIEFDQDH
jgi:hypothetical protein